MKPPARQPLRPRDSRVGGDCQRVQAGERYLLYSHDGLGLGHLRRNLAIAAALSQLASQAAILLVTGTPEAEALGLPSGVDVLKLPGLRKVANGRYAARHVPIPDSDIRSLRSALMVSAVESFCPSVILVDKHPLGVSGELGPALKSHRAAGGRAALGLRDVLDDPVVVRREWADNDMHRIVGEYHDAVLVYGQHGVLDPIDSCGLAALADRIRYCGYVASSSQPGPYDTSLGGASHDERPVVLATAGGGMDGFAVLASFLRASFDAPWTGVVVAGPQSPPEDRRLLRRLAADAEVSFHDFVPNLPGRFGSADALICMGGYNTLVEALSRGIPTVCVPRGAPRSEQLIRARAFADLGLLRLIEPHRLSPEVVRQELTAALGGGPRRKAENRTVLDMGGAQRAAEFLTGLAEGVDRQDRAPSAL